MSLAIRPLQDSPSPHLSVLLVSPGGYGKTTSLITAPKPLLIGDVDGGFESLFKEGLIRPEQREKIDLAPIRSYGDALEFATSAWKGYATIGFDSFSWFMSNIIKPECLAMSNHELMEQRDWGLYFERGLSIVRKLHELAMSENGCHVIVTSHEADKGGNEGEIGKIGPAVSGQLFDILPGIFNFVFFLRVIHAGIDRSGRVPKPILERKFLTEADGRTPAKARRTLLPMEKPDFSAIWEKVKPQATLERVFKEG